MVLRKNRSRAQAASFRGRGKPVHWEWPKKCQNQLPKRLPTQNVAFSISSQRSEGKPWPFWPCQPAPVVTLRGQQAPAWRHSFAKAKVSLRQFSRGKIVKATCSKLARSLSLLANLPLILFLAKGTSQWPKAPKNNTRGLWRETHPKEMETNPRAWVTWFYWKLSSAVAAFASQFRRARPPVSGHDKANALQLPGHFKKYQRKEPRFSYPNQQKRHPNFCSQKQWPTGSNSYLLIKRSERNMVSQKARGSNHMCLLSRARGRATEIKLKRV